MKGLIMTYAIGMTVALAFIYWQLHKTNMDLPRNAEKVHDGEAWDSAPLETIVYRIVPSYNR